MYALIVLFFSFVNLKKLNEISGFLVAYNSGVFLGEVTYLLM